MQRRLCNANLIIAHDRLYIHVHIPKPTLTPQSGLAMLPMTHHPSMQHYVSHNAHKQHMHVHVYIWQGAIYFKENAPVFSCGEIPVEKKYIYISEKHPLYVLHGEITALPTHMLHIVHSTNSTTESTTVAYSVSAREHLIYMHALCMQ